MLHDHGPHTKSTVNTESDVAGSRPAPQDIACHPQTVYLPTPVPVPRQWQIEFLRLRHLSDTSMRALVVKAAQPLLHDARITLPYPTLRREMKRDGARR